MELTVRDVAKLFGVSQRTVDRWIKEGSIPVRKVLDRYCFNRAELLEWAVAENINLPRDIFEGEEGGKSLPDICGILKAGGVHYGIKGNTRNEVLQAAVNVLNLPVTVDKDFLLNVIIAREEMVSTGIGEGIAVPHPRNPMVLPGCDSLVALCFLEKPVDFGAIDARPVHCLFILLCATVRVHLHLLSRLAFILQDRRVKEAVQKHDTAENIFKIFEAVEKNCLSKGSNK